MKITIPYNFEPRPYQVPLFNAIASGYKRAVAVWHRRAGKDKTLLNLLVKEAFKRVGVYYYFFPTYNQGRKVLWDGIDRNGFRYMDHIPEALRESTNQAEMKVKLKNHSLIQIIGTDNVDAVMGTNPVGCVFSEYSLQAPTAWDLIRPILAENGGWAVFNYTPRGRNHGFVLYEMAKNNRDWFCELMTIEDTGAVGLDVVEEERRSGMSEEMVQQEFYCSFEACLQSCFFMGALDGHRWTRPGVVGGLSVVGGKPEFVEDPRGILELWRYPFNLVRGYDGNPWAYRYCIGSDISEGLGGDMSVAYVYDRVHNEIVARMRSNRIDSHRWGDRLYDLSRYYCGALIVPERNGAGITTIDRLIELGAPLYFHEAVDKAGGKVSRQYGYLETKESKQLVCGELKSYLAMRKKVYDKDLLAECATFIKDEERQKLEADNGFHDDHVIAGALAVHGNVYLPQCSRSVPEETGWRTRLEEERAGEGGSAWAA